MIQYARDPLRPGTALAGVTAALCFLAVLAWPDGWYGIFHWTIFLCAAVTAFCLSKRAGEFAVCIVIATLFNPILAFHASVGMWRVVDIAAALAMFVVSALAGHVSRKHAMAAHSRRL